MLKLLCRCYESPQQYSSSAVFLLDLCVMCFAHRSNKLMISAGADKLLKVWDVAAALAANPTGQSSKAVPSLKAAAATSAHDKDINAVAVAPNDSLLCTTSQDRTAKVRAVAATNQIHTLQHTAQPAVIFALRYVGVHR